jgi:hypothetical protein
VESAFDERHGYKRRMAESRKSVTARSAAELADAISDGAARDRR